MRRRARELDPLAISGAELAWDLFYAAPLRPSDTRVA